jgi:3-hydroxyacyl-[acyl-carrier-protein] dehydratase
MVDQITALDVAPRTIRAHCAVPETSPVFEGHFAGHASLPGVLLIETMAQTGGLLVLALWRFERMPILAQVKEAKLLALVTPGASLLAGAQLQHDGSGFAVVTASIDLAGQRVAEAEITFRAIPFPNEIFRAATLATAHRVGMPGELLTAPEA